MWKKNVARINNVNCWWPIRRINRQCQLRFVLCGGCVWDKWSRIKPVQITNLREKLRSRRAHFGMYQDRQSLFYTYLYTVCATNWLCNPHFHCYTYSLFGKVNLPRKYLFCKFFILCRIPAEYTSIWKLTEAYHFFCLRQPEQTYE